MGGDLGLYAIVELQKHRLLDSVANETYESAELDTLAVNKYAERDIPAVNTICSKTAARVVPAWHRLFNKT